ncbi:MAG: hypothetical protein N4A49_04265 [Marinifilaceae bacterium]|jgi:hypothetical protein|nr:hypothetical protein [Marinifilaceae bacterium]
MKSLQKFLFIVLFALSCTSCVKDDYEEIEFQVAADMFVRVQNIDNVVKYSPVIYVYGNYALSNVKVYKPSGTLTDYQVEKYSSDPRAFRMVPSSSDYSENDIENGDYEFKVERLSSKQESISIKDKILEKRLDALNITEFNYNKDKHSIDIKWDKVDKADYYLVKIMDKIDGGFIFYSNTLSENSLELDLDTKGWNAYFEKKEGDSYVVGVFAYDLENPSFPSSSDINSESVEYRTIVW